MSGGWLLSVGSHATNKQMAFNFITLALDQQNSLYYDIGRWPDRRPCRRCRHAFLQGVQRLDHRVFELRAIYSLPPRLHRVPQALQ